MIASAVLQHAKCAQLANGMDGECLRMGHRCLAARGSSWHGHRAKNFECLF